MASSAPAHRARLRLAALRRSACSMGSATFHVSWAVSWMPSGSDSLTKLDMACSSRDRHPLSLDTAPGESTGSGPSSCSVSNACVSSLRMRGDTVFAPAPRSAHSAASSAAPCCAATHPTIATTSRSPPSASALARASCSCAFAASGSETGRLRRSCSWALANATPSPSALAPLPLAAWMWSLSATTPSSSSGASVPAMATAWSAIFTASSVLPASW
mmetsp:Transcript_12278/g.42596  ORF Transcript_12278/g.42596 Transcript_12278/m.42596 type:complete len:217 (+) Transcript_12278:769-1419(+)